MNFVAHFSSSMDAVIRQIFLLVACLLQSILSCLCLLLRGTLKLLRTQALLQDCSALYLYYFSFVFSLSYVCCCGTLHQMPIVNISHRGCGWCSFSLKGITGHCCNTCHSRPPGMMQTTFCCSVPPCAWLNAHTGTEKLLFSSDWD